MSTLSLRLPESIHEKLGEVAEQEGISINQLINSAVAEKLAALLTEKYFKERMARADRQKFEAVLAKIPDAAPIPGDEYPVAGSELANKALQRSGPPREAPRKSERATRRRSRRFHEEATRVKK